LASFLMLGLLWGVITFIGLRFRSKLPRRPLMIVLFWAMLLGALVIIGIAVYDYTESPEFCAKTCKSMEPYYDTYIQPGNNTVMAAHRYNEVDCADCHNGPGIIGATKTRVGGLRMVVNEWTNNYDQDHIEGEMPNEFCEKSGCHDGMDWVMQSPTGDLYHPYTEDGTRSPVTGESCLQCHNPRIGNPGLTRDSCTLCHDVTPEEIEAHSMRTCGMTSCHLAEEEAIGHRPQSDACSYCHNRDHPNDAKVPYSVVDDYTREDVDIEVTVNKTFCSDCHMEEYEKFIQYSSGDCLDCHIEHNLPTSPHTKPVGGDSVCSNCHINMGLTHDPTEVSFSGYEDGPKNEFCDECHDTEYDIFKANSGGNCVSCHNEHLVPEAPHILPNDEDFECSACHVDLPDKHTMGKVIIGDLPDQIVGEYCVNCHVDVVEDYTPERVHVEEKGVYCTSCHDEHGTIKNSEVWGSCESCHSSFSPPLDLSNHCNVCHSGTQVTTVPVDWVDYSSCEKCHGGELGVMPTPHLQDERR